MRRQKKCVEQNSNNNKNFSSLLKINKREIYYIQSIERIPCANMMAKYATPAIKHCPENASTCILKSIALSRGVS